MDTIGFIGLGAMGAPMAWNLADAGYTLQVYNRSSQKTQPFREEGLSVKKSPREAARGADAVVVMVTDDAALRAVLEGEDGAAGGVEEGALLVQSSTVSREATAHAAEAAESAGARFVDAPVSGTVGPAEEGTLTVLAGGTEADVEAARPLLEVVGGKVLHCGAAGQGTAAKLFVNLVLGGMMETLAEGFVLGKKMGLAPEQLAEALSGGAMDAPLVKLKGDLMRAGDFAPQFPIRLLLKDLNLALAAGAEAGATLPGTAAAREALSAAQAMGHGDQDMAALVTFFEAVAGTDVRDVPAS